MGRAEHEPVESSGDELGEAGGKRIVKARLTRRPNARKRRFPFLTKMRVKNLSAPLDVPGAELAELPVVGVFFLALIALVLIVVVGIFLGGFLIAAIEFVLLGAVAVAGSTWAWLRGHPKVAVMDIGDHRWVRAAGPSTTLVDDAEAIAAGTEPSTLGYELTIL